jgi:hypothetical protein
MAIVKPIPTEPVLNPLHNYASYTYTWSLWWLDVNDYNALTSSQVDSAVTYQLGYNSYVVAEDAGLYPDRRLPSTAGLNYYIQDVEFTTVIGLNKKSKGTNMIEGDFTIVEPYGVTLIDSLLMASNSDGQFKNYLQQPYMLELNFTGYDDNGDPIGREYANIFRKRFPIKIIECKFSVGVKGTEYKLKFVPTGGGDAHSDQFRTLPLNVSITAKTVNEFFNGDPDAKPKPTLGLVGALKDFYAAEVSSQRRTVADEFKFVFDDDIGKSSIVSDKLTPLAQGNPDGFKQTGAVAPGIDLSKNTFNIPKGTTYTDIINKVLAQSDWLINKQLGLEKPEKKESQETSVFNAFKVITGSTFLDYDKNRNTYGKLITYKIHQHPTWKTDHPDLPQLSDSTPYTSKEYNYIYTGKNIDIIDFKLQFDTTFYTAVNSYTKTNAATQTTKDTAKNEVESKLPTFLPSLGFLSQFIPQLGQVPLVSPVRYHNVVGDQSNSIGMNIINRPAAQQSADILKSVYSAAGGDMINVNLTIVGDPTLIKQDDWLYTPNPAKGTGSGATQTPQETGNDSPLSALENSLANAATQVVVGAATNLVTGALNRLLGGLGLKGLAGSTGNFYNSLSQASFAQQYGHIKMDSGDVVCTLTVNTPVDIDIDITNEGLVYPKPGMRTSFFSGQYKLLTVKNKFSQGVFTQDLNLVRYNNSDVAKKFGAGSGGSGAGTAFGRVAGNAIGNAINGAVGAVGGAIRDGVSTLQDNFKELLPTNGSSAAGDAATYQQKIAENGYDTELDTYTTDSLGNTYKDGSLYRAAEVEDFPDEGTASRSDKISNDGWGEG